MTNRPPRLKKPQTNMVVCEKYFLICPLKVTVSIFKTFIITITLLKFDMRMKNVSRKQFTADIIQI